MKSKTFKDAEKALDYIKKLYSDNIDYLTSAFDDFANGKIPDKRVTACYPYMRIATEKATRNDIRLSYGFVPRPGTYETTLTRPDIFDHYYKNQIDLLLKNHGQPIEINRIV